MNNKFKTIIFYILSFTWGILPTIPGAVLIFICAMKGKCRRFNNRLYGIIGYDWGGVTLGPFFFCGERNQQLHILQHESGHGIQNAFMGPFWLVLVAIPSAIRYWYLELKYYKKGLVPPCDYDDAWFEGQATKLGRKFYPENK